MMIVRKIRKAIPTTQRAKAGEDREITEGKTGSRVLHSTNEMAYQSG
jgi:hypothetical protein